MMTIVIVHHFLLLAMVDLILKFLLFLDKDVGFSKYLLKKSWKNNKSIIKYYIFDKLSSILTCHSPLSSRIAGSSIHLRSGGLDISAVPKT
jgi:hypothetical protein